MSGRHYDIDWAGPHGTALGTINGLLAAYSVSWIGHACRIGGAPKLWTILAVAAVGLVGIILVLARAAIKPVRPATLVYQLACVGGAGAWTTWTVFLDSWPWRSWLGRAGILAAAAVVAGILAALVKDDPAEVNAAHDDEPMPELEPTSDGMPNAERQELAREWKVRIEKVCKIAVSIRGVKWWDKRTPDGIPVGYTIEAICPTGGSGWETIKTFEQGLANDLDLPLGCTVEVMMGVTRRAALIKVSTVNMLATEQPYPSNHSPLDINGPLPLGVTADGEVVGVTVRQMSVGVFGQKGSGKTNALHDVAAGVTRCTNALLWDVELAGGGLSRQWARTFLDGRTKQPGIDWIALDEHIALFMVRAARRITHARKEVYQDLMASVDDDKIPCSPTLPAIMIRHDEIAATMGTPSKHPEIASGFKFITFEARASGVNVTFGALEATTGFIDQDTQRQLGAIAVMRSGNEACYAWALGSWGHGIRTADIPYPGNAAITPEPGVPAKKMVWYRIKPAIIEQICIDTDGRHPTLDEPSRLAADGRNPDGTPMSDLLPGELDCYSNRWRTFQASKKVGTTTTRQGNGAKTMTTQRHQTPQQAIAGLADATRQLEEAVAEAKRKQAAEAAQTGPGNDDTLSWRPEWDEQLNQLLDTDTQPAAQPPVTPAAPAVKQPNMRDVVVSLVPTEGIGVGEVIRLLREKEIDPPARQTIYDWLNGDPSVEWRPDREGGDRGKFYRI
jgi:hypothetical protein